MDSYKFGIKNQSTDVIVSSGQSSYPPSVLVGVDSTFDSVGINVRLTNARVGVDVSPGYYIHSLSTNECIMVKQACQDGTVNMERAFSSDVTGDPLRVIINPKFSSISIRVTGQGNGIIQGQTFGSGSGISSSNEEGLAPIGYDGTGTSLTISVLS